MANSYARAILQHRSNSHPFEDRYLEFKEAIKVGRAVARCKPLSDNAIFDCKVLSRNHALLWFDSGKFLLRDTRSSNGTFVNNHRLSPANEDSPPEELFSGDVVQFGVEVMESAKKMTHGCIVLSIKLYYPNGEETIRPSNHISNHMMMPSNLLFEPSTFMQQQDQASMLPGFMLSENLLLDQTIANNGDHISNGSTGTLSSNNSGSSNSISTITFTSNTKTYPNNSTSFKANRQNKSFSNNGKPTNTTTNAMQFSSTGCDGSTATIQKRPIDPAIKEKLDKLDRMCTENYSNSTFNYYDFIDHSQGANNNIDHQQPSFCPPTSSNNDQLNSNGNSSINMMGVVSSYYCETINFFSLLKEASQREQLLRQKLQLVEKALGEAHLAADKGWKACIEEDLLLSKIEALQKKLEFLMRANKISKLKGALKKENSEVVDQHSQGDAPSVIINRDLAKTTIEDATPDKNITSSEEETINDLEQQLQEKVLNYIDDKAKFELIAKEAIKKALQKEYLAFQQIHDLEALLKSSEDECVRLKQSNERLEQLNTSRDVVHQKQSEEMTQERLILTKDIDDLKQANSQLTEQYENFIQESEKKVVEFEHRLELASQQICDMQLKDKQLDNLRYQLKVVNTLYQQADENNQHMKKEVDVKTSQLEQLLERIRALDKENVSLKSELQTHKNREIILCNQEKEVNFCAIIPPLIILLTVLIAYLIGTP